MRIISKYHDYYDTVRAYGTDNTIRYIRKEEVLTKKHPDYKLIYKTLKIDNLYYINAHTEYILDYYIVSFCGKVIPIVEFYLGGKRHICYNIKSADEVVKQYGKKEQQELWEPKRRKLRRSLRSKVIDLFKHISSNTEELHHHLKAPVFMYGRHYNYEYDGCIVINPKLSKLEFYKYMDAYTAYQELAQYVGGILSNTSQPPDKISDEDKKAMHGFDKWSFKTMPGIKK